VSLRDMDLGGNRLREFNNLAQHAVLEMPSCSAAKIYGGQSLSNHST